MLLIQQSAEHVVVGLSPNLLRPEPVPGFGINLNLDSTHRYLDFRVN